MKLILASQSPRRREMLTLMGLKFEIIASDVEEIAPPKMKQMLSVFFPPCRDGSIRCTPA